MTQGEDLTHINEQGRARMVDVSAKEGTQRVARAAGFVHMATATLELVRTGGCKKGDVLAVAQVAGIMAAKRCWELVPMCHPIQLTGVDVRFELSDAPCGVAIEAECPDGGVRRGSHHLRHAQGRAEGHGDRRRVPAREVRRQVGALRARLGGGS